MRAWLAVALISAPLLLAQTEHKDKATDYPLHTIVGRVAIGADYLIHSIPVGDQTFFAKNYLVVEVAVFPPVADPVRIDGNTFKLRLNGQKLPLTSDAPGFVAASLKFPDWEPHPVASASAGVGDADVIIGPQPTAARFPGDPNAAHPIPPAVPSTAEQNGIHRDVPETIDEILARTALLEGLADHPVSGFLYFPYKGKLKSLKSIELVFQSNDLSTTLKLQ